MTTSTTRAAAARTLGLVLAVAVALTACSKKEEAQAPAPAAPTVVAAPVATAPPPAAAPAATAPEKAPFAVTGVEIGRAVDAQKKISEPTTEFSPNDTIYGDDAQLVTEQKENVAPTGPAATEFHVSKPGGWPTGTYAVEITANGVSAGKKTFTVK
jgi:hypothetical protein